MRTVVVRNGTRILLGKQGENNAVRVVWPEIAKKYTKLYGDGRFELVVVQKGQAYPAVVNVDGPDLIWNVLTADVATVGAGSLELIYYVGDTIAKSQTWETFVEVSKSSEGTAEPPEPAKNWVDKVLEAGQAAVDASVNSPKIGNNGNWWVWDFKAGAYVDTGVAASGGVSAVYSVNGQTGTVELTAKDVGAISQDDLQEATNEALAQAKASGEFDGEQGPPGSDATVTAENIQSALGYTPADSADVSAKLDKPATPPEVGKILKVTAVNEDGSFVCEWANAPSGGAVDDVQVSGTSVVDGGVANIPMANQGVFGVVKFDTYTPFIFNAGALRLANADESELTNPRYGFSTNRVITAANYRLAVKLAICDGIGAAWTAEEQAAARERIGLTADGVWQYVTLTADDYDAENHRFLIDAGEGKQITEVYGIGQVVTDTPADADLTVGIGFGNANNIFYGAFSNYSIKATDTQTSFSFDGKSIDFTNVKSDTYSQFGTTKYNTSKSTTSSFYVDGDIKNAANARSLIYWKYNNPRYFSIFGLWDNVTWAAIKIYIKLR